jgi:hypothetical protein
VNISVGRGARCCGCGRDARLASPIIVDRGLASEQAAQRWWRPATHTSRCARWASEHGARPVEHELFATLVDRLTDGTLVALEDHVPRPATAADLSPMIDGSMP